MFTKASTWFRSMSPVKCLCVSFAFESELHSLALTQRAGSKLRFGGREGLQTYPSVAEHWSEHQIKADLYFYKIFSALHPVQPLFLFRPCVLKEAMGTQSLQAPSRLCMDKLSSTTCFHNLSFWNPFIFPWQQTLSSDSSVCTLSLQQVMTEHSDFVAFPTEMDINGY